MRRRSGPRGDLATVDPLRLRPVVPAGRAGDAEPGRDAAAWAWTTRMPRATPARLVWDGDLDAGPPPFGDPDELRLAPDVGARLLCFSVGLCFSGGDSDRLSGGFSGGRHVGAGAEPDGVIVVAVGRRSPRPVRGRLRSGRVAAGTSVALQTAAGDPPGTAVDGDGRFALPWSPGGPTRLVVRRPGSTTLVTEWILTD